VGGGLKRAFPGGKSENGVLLFPGVKRKSFAFDPGM